MSLPARARAVLQAACVCFISGAVGWGASGRFAGQPLVIASQSSSNSAPGLQGPRISDCAIFPADNVWNTPVDGLPRDRRSDAYIGSIGPHSPLHPDFGSDLRAGIPYMVIPAGTPGAVTKFEYRDESDLANYPIPAGAPVEGGGAPGSDRHILLIDVERCLLYELFAADRQPDGTWKAGAGIRMDLTGNGLRPEGWTSADAAGLPILPGLVRYDEVAEGEIRHALRFTVPHTRNEFVWPARHQASRDPNPSLPPMGQRFRLRAGFDVSGFSASNQVILKALKKYGMFLADNGGAMFITGAPDRRWKDDDLNRLKTLRASDFEAVDESELEMTSSSARVDTLRLRQYQANKR